MAIRCKDRGAERIMLTLLKGVVASLIIMILVAIAIWILSIEIVSIAFWIFVMLLFFYVVGVLVESFL